MTAIVGTADLQVTQRVSNSQPAPGAPLTYTIDVKNAGPNTALGAALSEYVGVDGTPLGATSSNGAPCSVSGQLVSCGLGDVASGSTVTVSVSALAPLSFSGTIASTAAVTSSTYDPNLTNNTASASVRMP